MFIRSTGPKIKQVLKNNNNNKQTERVVETNLAQPEAWVALLMTSVSVTVQNTLQKVLAHFQRNKTKLNTKCQ